MSKASDNKALTLAIIQTSLTKMEKSYFNICTVDKILKTFGISSQSAMAYNRLNLLHCVDFSEMPVEIRKAIPNLMMEVFGEIEESFPFEEVEEVIQPEIIHKKAYTRLCDLFK